MAVTARPASTVVLVRPTAASGGGWETYLLRRSAQSPVLADLWVFPGGTLRADDLAAESERLFPDDSAEAAHTALNRAPGGPPPTPGESLAYFAAAIRELFEEAGVLLGSDSGSGADNRATEEIAELRRAVEQGRPFSESARELGVRFSVDDLVYYAHWITPEALPQRFDTRFFMARMPDGREATPSPFEMAEGIWIGASAAIERAKARELALHFATVNHLRRLAAFEDIAELLAFARTKLVVPVMPNTRETDGRIVPFLPPELDGVW